MSLNLFNNKRNQVYIPLQKESVFDAWDKEQRRKRKVKLKYNIKHTAVELANLPFEPSYNEVIYIEDEYDEATNNCIRENYELIKKCFAKRNLRFVYLPWIGKEIEENKGIWKYLNPHEPICHDTTRFSIRSNGLLDFMIRPQFRKIIGKPCFARYNSSWLTQYRDDTWSPWISYFDLYIFDINDINDVKDFFKFISKRTLVLKQWYGDPIIYAEGVQCYHSCYWKDRKCNFINIEKIPQNADDAFDNEAKQLLSEVEYKIDLLRRKGISQAILQELVMPKPKLSKLVVTKDLRIFLPDYDNMEITMEPLVKAVFLLFLKHPEGIMFKELPEYRRELAEIYGRIKGARVLRNLFGIRSYDKSIINATDPLNNSINEKCARIRAAFLLKFQESLAENYFITGKRGEPKTIKLPRNMVEWEE